MQNVLFYDELKVSNQYIIFFNQQLPNIQGINKDNYFRQKFLVLAKIKVKFAGKVQEAKILIPAVSKLKLIAAGFDENYCQGLNCWKSNKKLY